MAKKYFKNENGIVRAITSDNLGLEKPLANENYDIEVHNRNMDKIDGAIQNVRSKIDGLELIAERVSIADSTNKFEATNVEDALLENKTSILTLEKKTDTTNTNVSDLKAKVDNGQNYKITGDNGFTMQSGDCNIINPNIVCYVAPTSLNIPHSNFNGYVETHCHGYGWGLQEAYDCFSTKKRYEREIVNGKWQPWRLL